jgi:glycosyltransferase involved in cell wall biosynthesis
VNAEYVHDGVTGFHAINTSQWIDRVSKLIKDRALRKQTGQAGRNRLSQFDTSVLGKRLINLIVEVLEA